VAKTYYYFLEFLNYFAEIMQQSTFGWKTLLCWRWDYFLNLWATVVQENILF